MTPDQLISLRQALGLDKKAFAAEVGVTRKTLAAYEAAVRPIPQTVALACAALARGLRPFGE